MYDSNYGSVEYFYREIYGQMDCGNESGIVARVAHRAMEARHRQTDHHSKVLEVGAGFGLHLKFIQHTFDEYLATDIHTEFLTSMISSLGAGSSNVRTEYADAESLTFESDSFDRLIATCVLAHLRNPEQALEEWRRVTKPGGSLTIYVPTEPSLMLRFGRKLTTARTARRLRFHGYNLMLARDHINHAWGLNQLIKYVFREDKITVRTWPFSIAVLPSAFRVYEIKKAADGYAFPHT